MCFRTAWQILTSFYDYIGYHESQISFADHMYLLLTVFSIYIFSKINVFIFLSIFLVYLYLIIYLHMTH